MLEQELITPTPECSTLVAIGDGKGEHKADTFTWRLEYDVNDLLIHVTLYGKSVSDQLMITLRENSYTKLLLLDISRNGSFFPNIAGSTFKITEENEDLWHVSFRVPYALFTSDSNTFRIAFGRNRHYDGIWNNDCAPAFSAANYRLCLGIYQPQYMYRIKTNS